MINHSSQTFDGLGIAPKLLAALDRAKFIHPTPIQARSIPVALEGKDMIGIAQTGTGKTLAFGIPMLQRLAQIGGQGLIILPTRELAIQVDEMLCKIGKTIGLRTAVIIGGANMPRQKNTLKKNPHIIIATPGRLIDHLDQRSVSLSRVKILILDEADRMFDMGFKPQINRIIRVVPTDRQTMLFSATMADDVVRLATAHMKLPMRVEIARPGTAAEKVTHELFVVAKTDKIHLLNQLLSEYRGTVLVFSRTKHGAKKIARDVRNMGVTTVELHSARSMSQRREALSGFKTGRYRVLVATDIAARGIDVTGIEVVINFDLPEHAGDYVHRIGRTGRAGHVGHAISFATPDQGSLVRSIEKFIRTNLPAKKFSAPASTHKHAPLDSKPYQPHKFKHRPPRRSRHRLSRR